MQTESFQEKRVFPRYPVRLPLGYFELKACKTLLSESRDISVEGLCLEADLPLEKGGILDIYLEMIDSQEKIHIQGRVVWTQRVDYHRYRVGVKLEGPHLKPIPIVLRTIKSQRKY